MKVEITQEGVYDGKGKRIPVGTEIDVKGDTMPNWLKNKARSMGKAKGKTAVTNPAEGAIGPSAQERQARMKELVAGLDPEEDFTSAGLPEVGALNALLNEGETTFTAAERDQLWPGIKDG